jgi:hypothetical protein
MNSTKKIIIVLSLMFLTACRGSNSKPTATLDVAPTLHITNTPRVLTAVIATESTPTLQMTATPRHLPTDITTKSTPTSTEVLATATLPSGVGHIYLSGAIGDAGYWFVFATSVVTLTWIDPPSTCNQYDFVISDSSSDWTVIGTDLDPSDGILIEWQVPEHISYASLMGKALCEESSVIHSLELGILFSGDAPPEGVCVLISGTMGTPDLYLEPSLSSRPFAFLKQGSFAPVLERTQDGWYRIDTIDSVSWDESQSMPEFGWITDIAGIKLFGPCDRVPVSNGP